MFSRSTKSVDVTAGASEGASSQIPYTAFGGGMIFVPGGSLITEITWYAAAASTFLPASDADGTALVQTVAAGNAYQIPDALFGAASIKAVVTGGSAGTITVCRKK